MKTIFHFILRGVLLAGALVVATPPQVRGAELAASLAPVGETKPFRGTLRAKDLRLGTLAVGTSHRVVFVVALDAASRLVKENRPATFAEFQVGDAVEGFSFPDQFGRQVVAVATARGRSETAKDSHPRKPHAAKARPPRTAHSKTPKSAKAAKSAPVQAAPKKPTQTETHSTKSVRVRND